MINGIMWLFRIISKLIYNVKSMISILTWLILLYGFYKIYETWIFDKILEILNKLAN